MAAGKNTDREAREARERLRRYTARQTLHDSKIARRKRDNVWGVGVLVVVAAIATAGQLFYFNGGPGTPTPEPSASASDAPTDSQNVGAVPDPSLANGREWTGELTLNDVQLAFTLDGAAAPQAVSSFIDSTTSGYYVGKTCHRLVVSPSAGLLQCGSLDGTGAADPSYSFGPIENASADGIYPAGTIAIARGSDAYSQGRQFFIVFSDAQLPNDAAGGYTIIGQVTSGLDELVSTIVAGGIADGGSSPQDGPPVIATTITSVQVR